MPETVRSTTDHESTFDYRTDDAIRVDQFARWDELREQCPVQVNSTTGPRPVWYLLGYEVVRDTFQDYETFSSRSVEAYESEEMAAKKVPWIPVEIDPPMHTEYRALVAPFFAPKAIADMTSGISELAGQLIDDIAPRGQVEFVGGFAKDLPTRVFLRIMGMPLDDAPLLLAWIDTLMHTKAVDDPDYKIRFGVRSEVMGYLGTILQARRDEPRDDLITAIVSTPLQDGRLLTDQECLSLTFQLYMAGLDTVANALGYALRYLATHPEQRARVASGEIAPKDVTEEILRAHSVVNTSRVVTEDTEISGCPVHAGDRVILSTAAANRDPLEFDNADEVVLGRKPNRHIAFGAGRHRCLGSHLARVELETVITEWHRRIPNYRITEGAEIDDHVGAVSGLTSLPLEWDVDGV